MFVRRKANSNGTFSVMIVDKSSGKYRTYATLGTSKDPYELDRLEAKGRELIRSQQGPELPLFSDGTDEYIEDFVSGSETNRLHLAGPDIVIGAVYDKIGFGKKTDPMFRHLVVSRCTGRKGVVGASDYLREYTLDVHPLQQIAGTVDSICYRPKGELADTIRDAVERVNLCRSIEQGRYLVLADYLPYVEPSDKELSVLGKKKAAKAPARVGVVVLVSPTGMPCAYETCTVAAISGKRLAQICDSMLKRYGVEDAVLVCGADLLSQAAIDQIEKKKIPYLTSHGASSNAADAILVRNERAAERQKALRDAGLQKLQKRIDTGKVTVGNVGGRGYNRFLKLDGGSLTIDWDKVKAEQQNDGMQEYVTNASLSSEQIREYSSVLDAVIQYFAIQGADLMIRPILHRSRNRIDGHVCVCFSSLMVQKTLQAIVRKAGIQVSLEEAMEAIGSIMQLDYTLAETGQRRKVIVKMDNLQKTLYDLVDESYKKIR